MRKCEEIEEINIRFLQSTILFQNMSQEEIRTSLRCLRAKETCYHKGQVILPAGEAVCKMGLVVEGTVTIERNDLWGNRTILTIISRGGFFAETYALLPHAVMPVDAVANEDCRILFIHLGCLSSGCCSLPGGMSRLMANLLSLSVRKNEQLTSRSFHTSPKSVRGRLLSYFHTMSLEAHSASFSIPFDRQQLADYLNLDRSALSKELGRMKKEGILDYWKNHFTLFVPFSLES